jgi:hypothetical protein
MNPLDKIYSAVSDNLLYWVALPTLLLIQIFIKTAPTKTQIAWHSLDNTHVIVTDGLDEELFNSTLYSHTGA